MTLTGRLNLYFLSALAIVLAGFSTALYLLARQHLHRQTEERLDASLSVLSAAVEHTPEGVEWEPSERQLAFGPGATDQCWLVIDPEGHPVAQSGPAPVVELALDAANRMHASRRGEARLEWEGDRWRFRQIWFESANPNVSYPPAPGPEPKYPALGITVGASLEPARTTLRDLSLALAGLSTAVLLVSLAAGRTVCRKALRPVSAMAETAHGIDAAALDRRMPVVLNGDELEDLARAFNGLLERVQLAFERQQRFTGEASHQLRTPLTALIGMVEVAQRRDRSAEEYQRVLASVRNQADRLRRIVESLLFLARAEAEAQLPQREIIDLAAWLPDHLQSWHDHPRRGDLVLDLAPTRAHVHPVLMGELVNVLLDNAFKYSAPGSPVSMRALPFDGGVELSIEDHGTGIAPEDLPHLFEPFFRSSSARLRGVEGIGLGLAIARRIAGAFGGKLLVDSHPGKGSRFTLRLPAVPGPPLIQ